ncbi:MAG: hypothetical protein ACJAZB_001977 [Psychrosphaera sp.]|jgi:hypothetical protein
MDDGMSSIQGCLFDDHRQGESYSSLKLGLTSYVGVRIENG